MLSTKTLVTVLVVLSMALSGCAVLTGDGASYEADSMEISESAVSETSFTLERAAWENQSRDVEIAGEERTINVSSHARGYTWNGNGTESAGMAIISTPKVDVASQTMNPIADWSEEELIDKLADNLEDQGDLKDIEQEDTYTVDSLGEERTVTEFSATAERNGQEEDVVIHVVKFEHGDDIVIGAAVHPDGQDAVRDDIETMLNGLDH